MAEKAFRAKAYGKIGQVVGDGGLSIAALSNASLWVDIRDATMVGPERLQPPH
jgi:hypothetical protein